mmetsp:Transcript_14619/g.47972  ORF Transcript_14619/g.47972 Transcript_14619/m.47972 type:complete len:317 (-) Transcript_14619:703-1653(-)
MLDDVEALAGIALLHNNVAMLKVHRLQTPPKFFELLLILHQLELRHGSKAGHEPRELHVFGIHLQHLAHLLRHQDVEFCAVRVGPCSRHSRSRPFLSHTERCEGPKAQASSEHRLLPAARHGHLTRMYEVEGAFLVAVVEQNLPDVHLEQLELFDNLLHRFVGKKTEHRKVAQLRRLPDGFYRPNRLRKQLPRKRKQSDNGVGQNGEWAFGGVEERLLAEIRPLCEVRHLRPILELRHLALGDDVEFVRLVPFFVDVLTRRQRHALEGVSEQRALLILEAGEDRNRRDDVRAERRHSDDSLKLFGVVLALRKNPNL